MVNEIVQIFSSQLIPPGLTYWPVEDSPPPLLVLGQRLQVAHKAAAIACTGQRGK